MVIHTTGADSTSVTCQVTKILLIRHHFNKEIRKQVAGAKNIQTLRHAITLAQEAEIKLKKYKGLIDDNSSVMQVNSVPHSEILAVQGRSSPQGNNLNSNHKQGMNVPRLNWKANFTCDKYGEKGHLA